MEKTYLSANGHHWENKSRWGSDSRLYKESKGLAMEAPKRQLQAWNAPNEIQQRCALDIDSEPQLARNTGLICTIGQACADVETIKKMIDAGMNIARMNLGRGTYAVHTQMIRNVRAAVASQIAKTGFHREVAIALDITAPTLRTGDIRGGGELRLQKGQRLVLTTRPEFREDCTVEHCWVDSEVNMTQIADLGAQVFLDDGIISCICVDKTDRDLVCEVERSGQLGSQKRCQLPRAGMFKHVVMRKFRQDLLFAIEQQVDAIFCSYIESSDDVKRIREILGPIGHAIRIFAKIESRQSLRNVDYILKEADGLFVARLDLGLEMPIEKVFLVQKAVIAKCNLARKPVVCAAQMLESMQYKPRPTRAEMSDVANAVLDGTDCVTLTIETSLGDYPVESVAMCAAICREAESAFYHEQVWDDLRLSLASLPPLDATHTAAIAAVEASHQSVPPVAAIIVITTTGRSAFLIATYRPRCPILAVTRQAQTARVCHFYRGIHPLFYDAPKREDWAEDTDACINHAFEYGRSQRIFTTGEKAVVVTGWKAGSGHTNTMQLVHVPSAEKPLQVLVKPHDRPFDD